MFFSSSLDRLPLERIYLLSGPLLYDLFRLMARSKIVFDHLPKSAGTSVRSFIADSIGDDRISRPLGGFVINHFHLFEQFDVLQGHFYGRVFYRIHPDIRFVTILRHPVERLLSYYYYVRSYTGEHEHKELARKLTIGEFVKQKSASVLFVLFNNATMHFAAAMGDMRLPMKRLLSEAKKNLSRYDVVGITENMPAFFEGCCSTFGWPQPRKDYLENVTTNRIPASEISAETLDIIASYNHLDLELYEFARDLIEYRCGPDNTVLPNIPPDDNSDNVTTDRSGINVDLLEVNAQSDRKVLVRSGQKLLARILLQSDRISDADITVAFCLSGDGPVQPFQSSSQLLGHHIKLNPGDRMILTLKCLLPLYPGEYFLELCVMHLLSSPAGMLVYFRNKEFIAITVNHPANYGFLGAVNLCPNLFVENV